MFHRHSHQHEDRHFVRSHRDMDWGLASRHGRGGRHHGPHGGHDESRTGRRGGRLFDHGELRFVLLALVAEKPRHGYEIIKAIEERTGGIYSPSPGVVYPTLTLLEELGYAAVTEEGGKKLYTLTDSGLQFLKANQRTADLAIARMSEAVAARGEGPAPQIVRAMEDLRTALRLRLARGPLTEVQVQTIAAALDTAAKEVEDA
jgi:DNA-binding PadR family transcriptional regulator